MKPFDLVIAHNLYQLLEFIKENPSAFLVAGATDFIPFIQSGRWRTNLAIDITRVKELHFLKFSKSRVDIGTLTTLKELAISRQLQTSLPILQEAAASMADPLIRTRATIGGNLCTASPASDCLPPLMVLDAEVSMISINGERRISIRDFILAPGKNALMPGEILSSIRCSVPKNGSGMGFLKLGLRRAMAVAVVNAAALVVLENGFIQESRLALGAVAPTPVRCYKSEEYMKGKNISEADLSVAAGLIQDVIQPIDDVRSSAGYRRWSSEILARRVLEQSLMRAREKQNA